MRPRRDLLLLALGLGALALGAWRLSQPHALLGVHGYRGLGYDDGVYFGAAVELVHGKLPYKDFALLHPPAGVLVLSPAALLSTIWDTRHALAAARVLVQLVTAVNVVLAARLLRPYGRVAAATSGVLLAVHAAAVPATHTVLLEPFLVCALLLAAVLAFPEGALGSSKDLTRAGVALGIALLIKLWAVMALLPLLVLVAVVERRLLKGVLKGLAWGCAPALPFFVLAPSGFTRDVLLAQLNRPSTGELELSQVDRWRALLGIGGWSGARLADVTVWCVVAALAVALVCAARCLTGRSRVLWCYLAATAASTWALMLLSPELYDHYTYVPVALGVPLGVLSFSLILRRMGPVPTWGAWLVPVALVLVLLPGNLKVSREYLQDADDPGPLISAFLSQDDCVLTDQPTMLLVGSRFGAGAGSCPVVVDPFGLWLVHGRVPTLQQPYPVELVRQWEGWLDRADVVLLSVPYSSYLPFDERLREAFDARFQPVESIGRVNVYRPRRTA